jgi:hypothetical protein
VSAPAAKPFPDSATFTVEFEALLIIARFPLLLPAAVGVKVTVKDWLWPAVSINGKLNPLTVNPVPEGLTRVTVTVVPPELVKVMGRA